MQTYIENVLVEYVHITFACVTNVTLPQAFKWKQDCIYTERNFQSPRASNITVSFLKVMKFIMVQCSIV